MPARIHPGAVRHLWDHHVVTLRDRERRRLALVSLYAVVASDTLGPGTVAVLDLEPPGRPPVRAIAADPETLAGAMAGRLRGLGMTEAALDTIVPGRFDRLAAAGSGSVGWRIGLADATIEVTWARPAAPFWLDAPAPALVADEDIWACFIEYDDAWVTIDGVAVAGRPFADDGWLPKIGRSLSSAHVAFGEVRVEPDRRPGGEAAR